MVIKFCTKCEKVVQPEELYPRRRLCKPCHSIMTKETYKKNKEAYKVKRDQNKLNKKQRPREEKEVHILRNEVERLTNLLNEKVKID